MSRAKQLLLLGMILALIEGPFLYFVFTHAQNSHYGYTELTIRTDSEASYTFGNSTWRVLYNPSMDIFLKNHLAPPSLIPNNNHSPNLLLYTAIGVSGTECTAWTGIKGENYTESGLEIKVSELNSDHIVILVKPAL